MQLAACLVSCQHDIESEQIFEVENTFITFGGNNGISSFNVFVDYYALAKVEDRGWFGRWTRHRTNLSFSCGIRATGFPGSGRGWTQSNTHEIYTSWPASPNSFFITSDEFVNHPNPPVATLDYVTGGVDDEDNGPHCYDCCPWDCSDRDEDDIP